MKITDLESANLLFRNLEIISKEINSLAKYASNIKDNDLKIKMDLSHTKQEEIKKDLFDDDGSLIMGMNKNQLLNDLAMFQPGMFPSTWNTLGNQKKDQQKELFSIVLSEVIVLQILGVIVAHKEAERLYIIRQLNKLDIQVNL